ncbi:MAG: DUF503 domain-containing protein [Exilispira sp.]|jgi:uncharacterized protein YlxP (DUF503 family)|nr:DUF503 domain-containing protein [Exilispira sp.]
MIILFGYIELHIEEAKSIKDRRSVVRSVRDSLRNKFNVSVSEILVDDYHFAKIGISALTDKRASSNALKEKIINFIESYYPGRVCDYLFQIEDIEII